MPDGNSPEGGRVTAAHVARSLGISRATVGYVLNNTPGQTISEGTRARVIEAAARLGYRPHRGAQDLRRGRSNVVLLILPDWPMAYGMQQHVEAAAQVLDEAGYTLVAHHRPLGANTRPLWELLRPDVVIGMAPFDDDEITSMQACGIDRIVPSPGQEFEPTRMRTLDRGSALQIEHLKALGHTRIGYAAAAKPDRRAAMIADTRLQVAQQAAEDLGLAAPDVSIIDATGQPATDAVHRWHAGGITAVAAYDDDTAATVISAALNLGLAVPHDLAVIGHDDTPLAAKFVPSISSVKVDSAGLGRDFAQLALAAAKLGREHADEILAAAESRPLPMELSTPVNLVPRQSTISG